MTHADLDAIVARAASVYPEDAGWDGTEAEDALPVVTEDVPALAAALRGAWQERDAAIAAVDAVRADYAPRREPPTADEVRAVSRLWGRDHAARCVSWRSNEHGRWSESWNTEGCAAEVKASPDTSYMLFGPNGPVAWSELAALVRGGDRG